MSGVELEVLICNLRTETRTLCELLTHLEHAETLPAGDRDMLRHRLRHVARNLTRLERSFPATANN